jgi:hypothetical protein
MKRLTKFLGLTALSVLAACGGTDANGNPVDNDPLKLVCGFSCPSDSEAGGVVEGNANISGLPSVDAFFSAVLSFETTANGVSDGIQAQLDAIRADFGVQGDLAAGIKSQLDANLEAALQIEYHPARCAVDAQATLEASAKCDASVMGGKASVECKGSCDAELSASAKCDAKAELYCTMTAPELKCEGECQGSCTAKIEGAAKCDGTCKGSCDGQCSGYIKDTMGNLVCNGSCSGMCTGSCEAELKAAASCMGTCRGECTAKAPTGGCAGGIRAECRAMANASFSCQGHCEGEFEPPKVKAECEASAKAQAKLNVQCTPPSMQVKYAFKATADAKFKAALTSLLNVRLPALGQAVARANIVAKAGDDLGAAAGAGFKTAVNQLRADFNLKLLWGIDCAVRELDDSQMVVTDARMNLANKISAASAIQGMLKLGS